MTAMELCDASESAQIFLRHNAMHL